MGFFKQILSRQESKEQKAKKVLVPIEGKTVALEKVNDSVFAEKVLGDGIAIYPQKNELYAPVSGVVQALFPTNHAVAILGDNGVEVLMHIGIDTAELSDGVFLAHVKQEDRVEQGQLLITFSGETIVAKGYDKTVMVIVTNTPELGNCEKTEKEYVEANEELLWF